MVSVFCRFCLAYQAKIVSNLLFKAPKSTRYLIANIHIPKQNVKYLKQVLSGKNLTPLLTGFTPEKTKGSSHEGPLYSA